MQKEMATHSSILAWEIPWREEPGRTQSMGSQIIKHNLATKKQQQHGSYSIVCLKNEKIVDLKSSHHKEEKKKWKKRRISVDWIWEWLLFRSFPYNFYAVRVENYCSS